jgi:hypothetical protein
MGRTALYLGDPGGISLEYNSNPPLEQRGGIYLFLRLMADRYGTDILKDIVQSRCSGRRCVENVTGEQFYDLVAEFLAALYLEDRSLTTDPRFEYTSIDLGDYGAVSVSPALVDGGEVAGDLFRTSGDFYVFSGGALGQESRFTFQNTLGNARLRHVVVRVE